ncbi:MAG: methyl-accepting chemotaxis protein [Ferrovibrio sp.]
MPTFSIRTTLGLVIGVLGIMLVAISAISLNEAIQRYSAAQKVATLAPISQAFFRSLQQHRLERGNIMIAFRADAPASKDSIDNITAQRDNTKDGYNTGYALLSALRDLPGAAPIQTKLKSAHDAVEAMRPKMMTLIAQPKDQRDAQAMQDWPRVTQGYLNALQEASDFLESSLQLVDPVVDQMLNVKQNAWTIRNYSGSMVLRILTTMSANQNWGIPEVMAHADDAGRSATAWDIVTVIAARDDAPASVREVVNNAKAFFSGPIGEERQTIVKALSSGQPSPVPISKYQPGVVDSLNLLNAIANTALDELIKRADAQMTQTQQSLGLNGALLVAAIAFTVFGFLIVQWRVSGPIQRMTGAMQRLADRDLAVEIPFVDRGAEIGQMAKAVQVFKDNMVAREKAEADIARQREESEQRRIEREAREKAAGDEIAALVNKVAQGDLSGRINEGGKEGFFLTTSQELNRLAATLQTMAGEMADTMGAMAGGDLTKSVRGDYRGVFGQLKDSANSMADRMRDFAGRLTSTAQSVKTASDEISSGSQDLAQRTESQAASIEETAASMHEITTTVKQNADNAQAANQLATAARDTAEKGGSVVGDAVSAVSRIEESAQKISDIVGLIDEIAFQTNLLALNASVEAARAGEAGKGFAVVAQEVRALAQRSANASKDIKALIQESNAQVKTGADLVGRTGQSLTEIVASIKKVSDIVAEIAAASREQATGLEQINTAVGQMDEMTQRNAALVEETTAAAQSLAGQASELADLVGFFKLDGRAPAATPKLVAVPPSPAPAAKPAVAAKPAPAKPTSAKPAAAATPAPAPKPAAAAPRPAAADEDDWQEF